MKTGAVVLFLLTSFPALSQPAENFHDPVAMAAARHEVQKMHGDSVNYLLIGERLEQQVHDGNSNLIWEAQAWAGKDVNKLWLKTEGDTDADEAEFQALFSHAISPFWDFQTGLRHDSLSDSSRDYAVIGLMGLAPYWFELDAAAFVSEDGDTSIRLEAEYELRFTQRLILQPRLEFNYSLSDTFDDDLATEIAQGLQQLDLGLRLRYEIKREIAPYLGLGWTKTYGDTAKLPGNSGLDSSEASIVFGFRVWY